MINYWTKEWYNQHETGPVWNTLVEFDHNFISFNVLNFRVYFMVRQEIWDPCIRYLTQMRTEEPSNIKWEKGGINISPCGRPPQRSEVLRSYGKSCNKNNKRARNFNKRSLNVRVMWSEFFDQRERCWQECEENYILKNFNICTYSSPNIVRVMKCLALSKEIAMALSQDRRCSEWNKELDGGTREKHREF
jgi:hypothetical protein